VTRTYNGGFVPGAKGRRVLENSTVLPTPPYTDHSSGCLAPLSANTLFAAVVACEVAPVVSNTFAAESAAAAPVAGRRDWLTPTCPRGAPAPPLRPPPAWRLRL